jgi:hypothetical protein
VVFLNAPDSDEVEETTHVTLSMQLIMVFPLWSSDAQSHPQLQKPRLERAGLLQLWMVTLPS